MIATVRRQLFAAVAFLVAGPLAALPGSSGLLDNGDFFGTTDPWIHTNGAVGTFHYTGIDLTGELGSGSARITNWAEIDHAGDDAFQCVGGILPGESYTFGGAIYIVNSAVRTGYATLILDFYSSGDCASGRLDGATTPRVDSDEAGQFVRVRGDEAVTAPAGTVAASVRLHTVKNEGMFLLEFHFDEVFLCAAGAPCPVFASGFEDGGSSGWSGVEP